nr:hypothetical protein [Tanacetum cinerariifolium]
ASKEYAAQKQQLENRCQNLSVWFQAMRGQFLAAKAERQWLEHVVQKKQQVIEVLVPYYPHPLTPDLQYAIELY